MDIQTELKPLTVKELEIVNYIEYHWHKHDKFPPVGLLEERFEMPVEYLLDHPTFIYSMSMRGITIPVDKGQPHELNQEQMAAILSILDYRDRRSQRAKLQSLKISTIKWNGWMKDPFFKDFYEQMAKKNFEDSLDLAQEGLMKSVMDGKVDAVKFYLELTGRYGQRDETQRNVSTIVAQIIETLQYHIKDPELMRSIRNDFDSILQGKAPVRVIENVVS